MHKNNRREFCEVRRVIWTKPLPRSLRKPVSHKERSQSIDVESLFIQRYNKKKETGKQSHS